MGDLPRATGRSAVVALFAVAVCALLAATTLTVLVLLDDTPEGSAPAAVAADRPSPTAAPPPGPRAATPYPTCLIGSWRSVDDSFMIKFYTNEGLIPFVSSGRTLVFRPDGTGTSSEDGVVYTGSFRGNQLRIVGHGNREFTWEVTGKAIKYIAYTRSDMSWSYFDQRGHLSDQPANVNPDLNEVDDYTCEGARMTESNPATQYQSSWVRTADYGVY